MSSVDAQTYAGPKALGPYQIDKGFLNKTLFDILGKPKITSGKGVFCYQSADGVYLWVSEMAHESKFVGDILLSSFPNCVHSPVQVTSEIIREWKTKERIGLGSAKKDVLSRYGKPSRDDMVKGNDYRWIVDGDYHDGHSSSKPMPERGEEVLVYTGKDTLDTAEFGLRNGMVTWILLSENE
jgi:hypothetical protein